jgi:hypothetical protein
VHATGERRAGGVGGGLGDSMVAIGELELDHIADGGGEYVGHEGVLGSAYYYWEECGEGGCWDGEEKGDNGWEGEHLGGWTGEKAGMDEIEWIEWIIPFNGKRMDKIRKAVLQHEKNGRRKLFNDENEWVLNLGTERITAVDIVVVLTRMPASHIRSPP